MKIDFNKVMQAAMPETIEIDVDGKTYRVKDPAILDVAGFDAVRIRLTEESEEAHAARILGHLRTWFEGDAPPFLSDALPSGPAERRKLLAKVTMMSQVIAELIADMVSLPNVVARSQMEARAQIQAQRDRAATGSGS